MEVGYLTVGGSLSSDQLCCPAAGTSQSDSHKTRVVSAFSFIARGIHAMNRLTSILKFIMLLQRKGLPLFG